MDYSVLIEVFHGQSNESADAFPQLKQYYEEEEDSQCAIGSYLWDMSTIDDSLRYICSYTFLHRPRQLLDLQLVDVLYDLLNSTTSQRIVIV